MKKGLQYLGEVVEEIKRCGMKAGEKVAKKGKKRVKRLEVIESEEESESPGEMEEEKSPRKEEKESTLREDPIALREDPIALREDAKPIEESSPSILIEEENKVEEVATSISKGSEELPTEMKAASPKESQSTDQLAVHKEESPKKDNDIRLSNGGEKDAESDSYFDEPEY